jgi:putative oxidoreductase
MPVLRAFARPLLASTFVIQGADNLLHPERSAKEAEPVFRPIAERVPGLPADPEQAVRLTGAIQLAAGTMLALGRLPRLSALAIAVTLVPTTLAGHRFWEPDDAQERAAQRTQFLKNAGLLGGLLLAAADTAGAPSLAWRGRHAAREARRDAVRTARTARVSARAGARAAALSAKVPGH